MTKRLITIGALVIFFSAQWPLGFAKGYQIKERQMCDLVKESPTKFKFAAAGIMRGESHEGTLQTRWYSDGLKKGMLYSLKQCLDNK